MGSVDHLLEKWSAIEVSMKQKILDKRKTSRKSKLSCI
jgi:hypothetical protein